MAPVHRMEMYHEHHPPPPPIPVKLKPKTLKKLSQAKGPVYVLLPNPPPPPHHHPPPHPPAFNANFNLMAPHNPVTGSLSESGSGAPSMMLDNHQRFRPDKNGRPRVQQLQWLRHSRNSSNWIKQLTSSEDDDNNLSYPAHHRPSTMTEIQLSSRVASMTIADVSPRFALKKILLLYENAQYRESANFINRLSGNTFSVIVHDLPVDLFIDSMPQSLPIIESLYAKVFLSDGIVNRNSIEFLRPENVVMQMVKYFANQDSSLAAGSVSSSSASASVAAQSWRWDYCGPFISSCKKVLRVIVLSDPQMRKNLQQKRRALDKAIEGLGQHGLVGTSDENMLNLHDALKLEFHRVVQSYKIALSKLEELDLAHKKTAVRTVSNGPAPIQASHQRQLSLRQNDIQERLIKNKTLLNVVEPTLTNHSLDLFLGILQRRIELDKDVLFQFTQLRKENKSAEANAVVAPLLMKYSHGCQQVLQLMREVSTDDQEDDDSSDVSGYHSDSDSAVMASGNSPFVSKSARYNFLTRSVRLGSRAGLRTSLLINSLGLESSAASASSSASAGRVKGRLPVAGHDRSPTSRPNSSSRFTTSSSNEESDCRSASSSSESCSAASLTAAASSAQCRSKNSVGEINSLGATGSGSSPAAQIVANHAKPTAAVVSCQRCVQQQMNPTGTAINANLNMNLQVELDSIKAEMKKANNTISALQEREKKMKDRLANQGHKMTERPPAAKLDANNESEQRAAMIRCYGNLYAQSRLETLDWLDKLGELGDAEELKSKLLFSVIVLAFRSVQTTSTQIKDHIRRILQIPANALPSTPTSMSPPPPPPPPCVTSTGRPLPPLPPHSRAKEAARKNPALEVEAAVTSYLRQSVDSFDLTKNTEDVCSQIWATLYDYPCLQSCEGLVKYIKDSVRLAWSLVNQSPPFQLEFEARTFKSDYHIRFHTSDPKEDAVKTYLWPALVEGHNGPCVHKAVVIT